MSNENDNLDGRTNEFICTHKIISTRIWACRVIQVLLLCSILAPPVMYDIIIDNSQISIFWSILAEFLDFLVPVVYCIIALGFNFASTTKRHLKKLLIDCENYKKVSYFEYSKIKQSNILTAISFVVIISAFIYFFVYR